MNSENDLPDIELDRNSLYREETVTDRQAGAVRRLVPIKADGSDDGARTVVYEGQTSILTGAGSLPLNFEIEADSLEEALDKFPQAAKASIERTLEELQELRRQQSSSILTPGQGGGDYGGGGGGGGGGMPGGGFKLR